MVDLALENHNWVAEIKAYEMTEWISVQYWHKCETGTIKK